MSTPLNESARRGCRIIAGFAGDSPRLAKGFVAPRSEHDPNIAKTRGIPSNRSSLLIPLQAVESQMSFHGGWDRHATAPSFAPPGRENAGWVMEVKTRKGLPRDDGGGRDDPNEAGTNVPVGTFVPGVLPRAPRTGCRIQNPAARSCSRSRSTAAGECSGLFSLKREGISWRCLATVRLATMAAMATRLTPKVRISASRVEDGSSASAEAPLTRQAVCVPASCSKQ